MHDMALRRTAPRSFAGPIVLIVIGVVFLLGNMGVLGWDNLIKSFARYWPLLLIVWGLVKAIEYYSARNKGYEPRRIGAGGVFLVVVVIILGLSASSMVKLRGHMLEGRMQAGPMAEVFFGEIFSFTDEKVQDIGAIKSLRVEGGTANLVVRGWDEPRVKLTTTKHMRARNEEEARLLAAKVKPELRIEGDTLQLGSLPKVVDDHPARYSFELYVPRNVATVLSSDRGDVKVTDRAAPVQVTGHGDIEVENLTGALTVAARDADLRIVNVRGDVTITGDVDGGEIRDIQGAVRLDGDVDSELVVARITKGLSYRTDRDTLELARLDGTMTLGVVRELQASGVTGPFRLVARTSKDVLLEEVVGDISVETRNGEVSIASTKMPLGNITVTTRNSDVTVSLPEKAAFSYQLRTRGGTIESEIPELRVNNDGERESTAVGAIGDGKARIQITNEHGDVVIRRNTPGVPTPPPVPAPPKTPALPQAREM